ncbi:toll/interleukin-1 receptor domain-containing protein [Brevibacillus fluminis]|uniref:Toll/interleukin-1 receptor domain-containing protein n=1 Tax=Brevibacillus fluminis TaxID=511487 RepID=A0A3M8DIQ3_9BACL|nr:toll/interleukin-1 receptor domain-containing protein [Brevibacillus fluminis]RNB87898.1 toll/interleukin-1 receptor domain-containing protein [Brevibacillus fluminis]
MSAKLDKDFVWECDYGIRKPIIPVLKKLLAEQDSSSLQMINVFVNSIPYNLELFIVVSYKNPLDGHIQIMKECMQNVGLRYRPDITMDELYGEMANRRFNSFTLTDDIPVEDQFNMLFPIPEKDELQKEGYNFSRPLGNQFPVFLSHASKNKAEVEDLIPYLNGANLPVWFDKVNIDYGESLVEAIQKGIKDSGAVIFWITNEFLKSNWCKKELRNFLHRHSSYDDVLIISIFSEDVNFEEVDLFLKELKFYRRISQDSLESIAKEIIPSIEKYMEKSKV